MSGWFWPWLGRVLFPAEPEMCSQSSSRSVFSSASLAVRPSVGGGGSVLSSFSEISLSFSFQKCLLLLCHVVLHCYFMLCYVMLCYVMLCYVMLFYVILCYVMLCYVMLCYVMLCYVGT